MFIERARISIYLLEQELGDFWGVREENCKFFLFYPFVFAERIIRGNIIRTVLYIANVIYLFNGHS